MSMLWSSKTKFVYSQSEFETEWAAKSIRNLHKLPRNQINTRDIIVFLVYFCCINILLEKAWSSFRQVGGATVVTYEQEIYIRSVFQYFGKKKVCGLCLVSLHVEFAYVGRTFWADKIGTSWSIRWFLYSSGTAWILASFDRTQLPRKN